MKKKHVLILFILILGVMFLSIIISKNISFNIKNEPNTNLAKEDSYDYLDMLNNNCKDFIQNEEMAIEYGEFIYKNAFPENYKKCDKLGVIEINTEEYGKVWKAYTIDTIEKRNGFGQKIVTFGGTTEILFKKSGELVGFDFGM